MIVGFIDDGIRDVWWYVGNNLGSNHQSGDATQWCNIHGIHGDESCGLLALANMFNQAIGVYR